MIFDTIIIGGGLSGLNCAYQLSKKKKNKILLIEKDYKLGGRVQSIYLPNNNFYESGAIRFFPSHKNFIKLLKEFNYKNKDFITINNKKLKKKIINLNCDKTNFSEKKMNQILLDNKNKYEDYFLLGITFETYCNKVLGIEKYKYLKICNGFDHIFKKTSALYGLQLLERDFQNLGDFYILNKPLSDLIYKIVNKIVNLGVKIKLNTELIDFTKKNNIYELQCNSEKYKCKNIIIAIPYYSLKKIFKNKSLNNMIETVNPIPLCRIFSVFPKHNYWHKNMNFTFTDNKIQRILTKNNELIQISYSSNENAKFWGKKTIELKKELVKNLKKMFKNKKIEDPDWINKHYWEAGIHLWKKNINGDKITKNIIKPYQNENIYICNEAYSYQQRWMEGAIEMSNRVVKILLNKK